MGNHKETVRRVYSSCTWIFCNCYGVWGGKLTRWPTNYLVSCLCFLEKLKITTGPVSRMGPVCLFCACLLDIISWHNPGPNLMFFWQISQANFARTETQKLIFRTGRHLLIRTISIWANQPKLLRQNRTSLAILTGILKNREQNKGKATK